MTPMPQPRRAAVKAVRYRLATPEDRAFLLEVYASTRAEEVAATGWPPDQQAAFLQMQAEAQDSHYRQHYPGALWLVVERGGQPAGRLYLERRADEMRIIDIALLPGARGQGVGEAILSDLIEDAAADTGCIRIHVEKTNPAMRLYRRLGFATVEDKGVYDLMEWRAAGAGDQVKTAS